IRARSVFDSHLTPPRRLITSDCPSRRHAEHFRRYNTMAKAGQHHNDAASSGKPRGHEQSKGRNRPERSQEIITGSYKKHETYEAQARGHSSATSDARPQ